MSQSSQCKFIYFMVCRGCFQIADGRFRRILRGDRGNGFAGMQIEFSLEIGWEDHTRNHGHIHMSLTVQPVLYGLLVRYLVKFKSIRFAFTRSQRQTGASKIATVGALDDIGVDIEHIQSFGPAPCSIAHVLPGCSSVLQWS